MGPQRTTNTSNRDHEGRDTASSSSLSKDDESFPYQQLGVLALCRLAEPIAFTSITAYSFLMVQEIKGPDNASFYSGLLVSAFALAEAGTAMFWGQLSDRYGRKPMILLSLSGTALSSLLFGFAKNYWIALAARVIGGLLNGNVAVMQTMVAEIVKKPEHEPRAYAMQPFMWSLGSIAGSALGGFTAEPARSYPGVFSPDGIFGRFPYLLPNLIAFGIVVSAMIQGYLFLKETNVAVPTKHNKTSNRGSGITISETTPLRQGQRDAPTSPAMNPRQRRLSSTSYIATSVPLPIEPSFDLRRPSIASIGSFKGLLGKGVVVHDEVIEEETFEGSTEMAPIKAFTRSVNLWILGLILLCYHQMALGAILPIYLVDEPRKPPKQLDLLGGLGKTLPETGTYLAVNSVIALLIQGFIFPVAVSKLGVWKAAVSCTLYAPLVYILAPFITLLPNPGIGIYIVLVFIDFSLLITYPCLLILLKNATPSPSVLGKVNGLAMSACSAARTLSPPLIGLFYSRLGSAAAWWSIAFVAALAGIEFCFISKPKDNEETIMRRASVAVEAI